MRAGAVHYHARSEITAVEIGVRFLKRRHHLIDLVSKDAPHIRDSLWERLRLRFTLRHCFARHSFELQPGMKLPVISRDAQTVRVRYMNEVYGIPVSATNLR